MKKILLLLILAVSVGFGANAQCTYTLELFDSFGDTWNGASIDVTVNGINVGNFANSGATSPESYTFPAFTGDVIELTYNTGSFDTENSYNLIDADGVTIFTQTSPPAAGLNFTGTAACPTCDYTLELFDSFGDTWNGASLDVTVNGVNVGNFANSGATSPESYTFPASTGEVIELTYNTGSFDTENSYNLIDPNGVVVFSETSPPTVGLAFTGTANCPLCGVPSDLSEVVTLPSTVDLFWSPSLGAVSYTLEYRVIGAPSWTSFAGNPVLDTTAQLTGLSTDLYEWQVATNCASTTTAFVAGNFSMFPFPGTCADAIAIGAGTYSAPGPSSGGGASNNCTTGSTNANWYVYTPTVSGTATISSDLPATAGIDTRVSVYEGPCGTLTCIGFDDDGGTGLTSLFDFPICAGSTYYIEWDDRWDNLPFDFSITETAGCAAPTNLLGTTETLDGLLGVTWDPGSGACPSGGGYSYEIVLQGDVAFSGNAIQSGSGLYPLTPFDITGLNPSTDYEIWVKDDCGGGLESDSIGGFWTTLSPPPVNDDCANAIPVFSGYSVTGFSTEGSTTEATGLTSCVFSATNAVWFTYTPTCDVTFEVNTNGTSALPNGYDTQISLWDDCSYTNELACDDDGGTGLNSLITFAGIANTTYYIRVSGFGGQTGEVNFEIIETVPCPCAQNVWTGANSTAWSDDLNWTCGAAPTNNCGAPLGSDIAIVPAGAAVTPVVTGTLGASSLEVGAGSSITIDGTLQVCGNVEHNGNAFTGAGNLELAGTATQMLSGNGAFGVLELNNTAGASVMGAASLSVDSALVLTVGTFTNNGSFSLNSALGGTAYLDDFTGTGSYSGDLTANRFVTDGVAGGLGQRLFGSAVSGSTVTGLDNTYGPFVYPMNDYIIPVAACDPDSLEPASPYSNLMSYDENVPTFCSQAGWFALNSNTAVLTSGRGYSGWMNNGSTISVTGAPNTGAQSYGVLSLTPANSQGAGYHVLSNPYPSPVLISEITNGTGLSSVQYYESSTGAWSGTYQPAAVSGLTVPVMQGFTALSDGTASLSLDNADRVASTNGFFAKSNNWFDYRLDVEVTMNGNGDITYLYYSSNSTDQFDVVGDCEKRESDSNKPTLYTRSNNKMMSLNGLNLNDLGTSVPMGLIAPTVTTASFSFTGMDDFPANTSIYVEDKVEGIFHNVTDGDYTFEANPAQNGSDRFEIHFVLPASFNLVEPTCENTNGTIIENTNDGRAFEIINNNTVVDNGILDGSSNELAAGDYTIEVYDQFGGSQLYDFTVEEIAAVSASIISSASAIEAGESVDFEFSGADATNYEWTIDGQVVAQTEMFSYQFVNPGQYEVAVFASNEMCEAIASYTIDVAEKTTAISTVGKGSLAIYGAEGNVVLNFVNINQGEVDAAVYNLLGQEVASLRVESSGKQTIQNVNWADGYYLVKVQIGEQVVNETVLLTK